ncbi:MAG: hypothetical protein V7K62_25780 [Nostoc sp.]
MKLLQVSDFNSITSLQVADKGFSHIPIIDISALVSRKGNNSVEEYKVLLHKA